MIFIWKDREDPIYRFEYKMDSEQCKIVEILPNWFGALISLNVV